MPPLEGEHCWLGGILLAHQPNMFLAAPLASPFYVPEGQYVKFSLSLSLSLYPSFSLSIYTICIYIHICILTCIYSSFLSVHSSSWLIESQAPSRAPSTCQKGSTSSSTSPTCGTCRRGRCLRSSSKRSILTSRSSSTPRPSRYSPCPGVTLDETADEDFSYSPWGRTEWTILIHGDGDGTSIPVFTP